MDGALREGGDGRAGPLTPDRPLRGPALVMSIERVASYGIGGGGRVTRARPPIAALTPRAVRASSVVHDGTTSGGAFAPPQSIRTQTAESGG